MSPKHIKTSTARRVFLSRKQSGALVVYQRPAGNSVRRQRTAL
jgi:hypothetical protein